MTVAGGAMIYGTAWKEDATARLTRLALDTGFRAIDTANQRKHYFEAAVGEAVRGFCKGTGTSRAQLFLQSKFTHLAGQDHRLPYDRDADVGTQVQQSFQSSLEHFATDYLDSYLMHGPSQRMGLAAEDWDAWKAMEDLHSSKRTRAIGVSNVTREQLELLWAKARVRPMAVQNRCYASRGWDREVRELCRRHGIVYQGFSLLTANPEVLQSPTVATIAARLKATPAFVVFAFAVAAGMTPLTGTTSQQHMREDLMSGAAGLLTAADVRAIEAL